MIRLDGASLKDKIQETREFMGQNFPSLVTLVDESVEKVVDLYTRANPEKFTPDVVELRDNALDWFSTQYSHLQEEWAEEHPQKLSPEETATLESFQQELLAIGDAVRKNGTVELTPKALARWLYYQLGDWIERVEDEQRGLTTIELEKLLFATGVVHTVAKNYLAS